MLGQSFPQSIRNRSDWTPPAATTYNTEPDQHDRRASRLTLHATDASENLPDRNGLTKEIDIVAAMPTLTDAELKQLMKQLARAQGWDLTDERVDSDLAAFKGYLAANEKIRAVPLPLEAEPFVKLKR